MKEGPIETTTMKHNLFLSPYHSKSYYLSEYLIKMLQEAPTAQTQITRGET